MTASVPVHPADGASMEPENAPDPDGPEDTPRDRFKVVTLAEHADDTNLVHTAGSDVEVGSIPDARAAVLGHAYREVVAWAVEDEAADRTAADQPD